MHFVIVKPMGHGSCILGHGSVFVWVSGSWVTAYDPLPALLLTVRVRQLYSCTLAAIRVLAECRTRRLNRTLVLVLSLYFNAS